MNDIDGLPPTEASPLLNRRPHELAQSEIDQPIRSSRYRLSGAFGIVSLLTFSSFCSAMSGALCIEPVRAMFEDAICTRHYAGREDEKDCKTTEVQFQVMWFQNMLYTVWVITSKSKFGPHATRKLMKCRHNRRLALRSSVRSVRCLFVI